MSPTVEGILIAGDIRIWMDGLHARSQVRLTRVSGDLRKRLMQAYKAGRPVVYEGTVRDERDGRVYEAQVKILLSQNVNHSGVLEFTGELAAEPVEFDS